MDLKPILIQKQAKNLVEQLKAKKAMPKKMEMAQLGAFTLISAYDEKDSEMISESATMGMDTSHNLALVKCLAEMAERRAFGEGFKMGLKTCQTEFSDGFAAYPRAFALCDNSRAMARDKAFQEAVERYVWATWWDNEEYTHKIDEYAPLAPMTKALLEKIDELTPVKKLVEVHPHFESEERLILPIFFAFLENGGVITGGACGVANEGTLTRQRAMGELFRHSLGLYRHLAKKIKPQTFYEKRLAWFGSGQGDDLIQERLYPKQGGVFLRPIELPPLAIDSEVPHSLDDIFVVYRCLFQNQPPFIGGKLERMCL